MGAISRISLLGLAAFSAAANLATTTRYYDGQEGACGCGTSSGNYGWQLGISTGIYTAAGSQALFDVDGSSWCGNGCGKCYNLTSTGSAPCNGCGAGEAAGTSIIVMVTNLCPHNGNEQWCPAVGGTNEYGYSYHFDIMAESEVFGDNPVVQFEPVVCPGQAASNWEQCVCHGQTANDDTPVGMGSPGSTSSTSSSNKPSSTPSNTHTLTSSISTTQPSSSTSTHTSSSTFAHPPSTTPGNTGGSPGGDAGAQNGDQNRGHNGHHNGVHPGGNINACPA